MLDRLEAMADFCRLQESELLVLVIPACIQAEPERWDRYLDTFHAEESESFSRTRFHEELVGELMSRGHRTIDMLPKLEAESRAGRPCYHTEGHWNARGHALAAQALLPRVRALLTTRASR